MKKIISTVFITLLVLTLAFAFAACKKAMPVKVAVSKEPTTAKVVQGQEPDLSGGVVTVEYDDGSVKDVSMSDLVVKGLKNDTLGTQTVALSYTENGKTVSTAIDLTVVSPKVTSLSVQTDGAKLDYVEGEVFNKQGIVVTATYQTGESAEVNNYQISPATLTVATTAVKITYRGVTVEVPVTVAAHAPVSMRIDSQPTKRNYFVGESFVSDGISVTVTHNDGTTESFDGSTLKFYHNSDGSEYFGPGSASDDIVKVVALSKYGAIGSTIRLNVRAVEPTSLTATVNRDLVFTEGDTFSFFADEEAISIKVVYNNGKQTTLLGSSDCFAFTPAALEVGQTAVSVWLSGYPSVTVNIPVTVNPPSLEGISVLVLPDKRNYYVGDTVDLTGLTLQLAYSNGYFDTLSYEPGGEISAVTSVIAEDQTVVEVTYQGQTTSFAIDLGA